MAWTVGLFAMMRTEWQNILERLRVFVKERDWGKFHDPKNLAMAIASEAGELLAELRWVTGEESLQLLRDDVRRTKVEHEVADIAIAMFLFCDRTGINLLDAVERKIAINERNYPVNEAKGRAERPNLPRMSTRVIAAVIERNDLFLICRRPDHKRHGGLWEFPGGKLELGESVFEAARRELEEEMGVQASQVAPMLFSASDPESDFVIEFTPTTISGEPRALEHSEIRWADLRALQVLDLAPSDRRFVEYLTSLRVIVTE